MATNTSPQNTSASQQDKPEEETKPVEQITDLKQATDIIEEEIDSGIEKNNMNVVWQAVLGISELLNKNRSEYMRDIPDLYKRLEKALAKAQWYCIDRLLPEEVEVLFAEHLEFFFDYELEDMFTKIDLIMRNEPRWSLRNDYKKKCREAIASSMIELGEEKISFGDTTAKPTIQNWFKDLRNYIGEETISSLSIVEYLNASDNVKKLSSEDLKKLEQLLKFYAYLFRDSTKMEGTELREMRADPVSGKYLELKRGEVVETEISIPDDELKEFREEAGLDEHGKPITLAKFVKTEEFQQELKKLYAQPVQHQEKEVAKQEKKDDKEQKKEVKPVEKPRKIHAGLPPLPVALKKSVAPASKPKKEDQPSALPKPPSPPQPASATPAPVVPPAIPPVPQPKPHEEKLQTVPPAPPVSAPLAPPAPPAPPSVPAPVSPTPAPAPQPTSVSKPTTTQQPAPEQILKELDHKNMAQRILHEHMLLLGSADLEKRFLSVMVSYLKGIRDKMEVREALSRAPQEGGVNLLAEQIDAVLQTADEMIAEATSKPQKAPLKSAKELAGQKKPTLEMVRKRMAQQRKISESKGEVPVAAKKEGELEDILANVSPIFDQQMQKAAAKHRKKDKKKDTAPKPVVADMNTSSMMTPEPAQVVMGPIDELRSINLVEFRRLADDPKQATQAIIDKVHLLEEESVTKKAEGIAAWQESPLNQTYLGVGNQSLEKSMPVTELLIQMSQQDEDAINQEEFDAIADLNRQLRF